MNRARPRLADVAALTPPDRDRLVDLLRAGSIVVVVAGHWLIATVVRDDGALVGANALVAMSWLHPATWIFQVMPVFFLVGGFSNARALGGPGTSVRRFLAGRIDRLLRPTLVFALVWLAVAAALGATSLDQRSVVEAAKIAAQPLWFLAVYVAAVALAPAQLALHRSRAWLSLVGLPALVVTLDLCQLADVLAWLGILNYLAVFLFAQELGFWYADGAADRISPRVAGLAAAAALALLTVLTTAGPYPVSMIGLPGASMSNMSPPTVCILVLTVVQVGVLIALRAPLRRWLARPRVWQAVVALNLVILTLFLWHLTAFIVASAGVVALGTSLPAAGSVAWWLAKPGWMAASAVVLAVIVLAASPVERLRRRPSLVPAGWALAVAVILTVRGLAGLAWSGFAAPLTAAGERVLAVRLSPAASVALIALGWALGRGRRGAGPPTPPPDPLEVSGT